MGWFGDFRGLEILIRPLFKRLMPRSPHPHRAVVVPARLRTCGSWVKINVKDQCGSESALFRSLVMLVQDLGTAAQQNLSRMTF